MRSFRRNRLAVAVDMTTGEASVATSQGLTATLLTSLGIGRSPLTITPALIDVTRFHAQVLVVRPGKGAWALDVNGNQSNDPPGLAKRLDSIPINVAKLHALRHDFSGPPVLTRGDVVAVIDPLELQYMISALQNGAN